jgi:hypothetical protein
MPNDEREPRIWQAALGPGGDCPPIEQLENLAESGSTPHVDSCAYCQTQLQMLREFQSASPRAGEQEAVRTIAARLRTRSDEILPAPKDSWWAAFWRSRWLSPAALALASLLVVIAFRLQPPGGPPVLHPPDPSREILRSNAISILAPVGDLQRVPFEISWQPAPSAVKYQARVLEVDGTELWRAETSVNRIELPAALRARIVPAKTLLCQVVAFDAAGRAVADSQTVRFRLLQ